MAEEEVHDVAREHGKAILADNSGGAKAEPDEEGDNRVLVYCRLRPSFDRDEGGDIVNLHHDQKTVSLDEGKTYQFDGHFGKDSTQPQIFRAVGLPVIQNVFKGYCGTVMCYGQTGTGKSHTMSNMEKGQEGIIMQSMMYMFDKLANDPEYENEIRFSFLQIYRDKVADLMNPTLDNLDIVRNDDGEVTIPKLTDYECNTREKFLELYERGDQERIVAATKMNPVSSRSHSCLMIRVKQRQKCAGGSIKTSKMWMIDLAGYERFSKTGILEGIRKEEAKCINASLLALGRVVEALSEKSKHTPWRNSKLTRLLQDAIGGKAKATICLTISPAGASRTETMQTLMFGMRAMNVKIDAILSQTSDFESLCKQLQELLSQEREKVSSLELQAANRQYEMQEMESRMQMEVRRLKARHEEQLKQLIESGADTATIEKMLKENEAEISIVQSQQEEERLIMAENNDNEIKEIVSESTKASSQEIKRLKEEHTKELEEVQQKLAEALEENERLKKKEEECHELNQYITTLKEEHAEEILRLQESAALNSGVSKDGLEQLKVEYEKQVSSLRTMMETTHEARMAEAEEQHEEVVRKLRQQLEQQAAQSQKEYETMKHALTTQMEEEIAKVKAKAVEVQEKLKRNHTIIKNSYQDQKEKLKAEIKALKEQHNLDHESTVASGKDSLKALMDQHNTIKKNYQDQIAQLKKELEAYRSGRTPPPASAATANGENGVPPPPPDDE
eukprot:Sspe_Gene.29135::Locus_13664_Transcript_1_1_Confidence_1.000_Length_2524::g.29135::m.29135/K10396/KIF5; kinesin family member 5